MVIIWVTTFRRTAARQNLQLQQNIASLGLSGHSGSCKGFECAFPGGSHATIGAKMMVFQSDLRVAHRES